MATADAGSLPGDRRLLPAPPGLQAVRGAWSARRSTLVLEVPSAVIPSESDSLHDPRHPGLPRVALVSVAPCSYDPRPVG